MLDSKRNYIRLPVLDPSPAGRTEVLGGVRIKKNMPAGQQGRFFLTTSADFV